MARAKNKQVSALYLRQLLEWLQANPVRADESPELYRPPVRVRVTDHDGKELTDIAGAMCYIETPDGTFQFWNSANGALNVLAWGLLAIVPTTANGAMLRAVDYNEWAGPLPNPGDVLDDGRDAQQAELSELYPEQVGQLQGADHGE